MSDIRISFANNAQATVRTKKILREQTIFPIQVNSRSLPKGGIQTIIWFEQGTSDATFAKAAAVLTDSGYTVSISARSAFVSACSGEPFIETAHAEALKSDAGRTDALSACEHGVEPQNHCAGCEQSKPAYAAQVDKVREIRSRVLNSTETQRKHAPGDECTSGSKHDGVCRDNLNTATRTGRVANVPTVQIHTAGELHPAPETSGRVTFTLNLSDLLDDPAHKPHPWWVKLDGTDARVEDFVFATNGAQDLYLDIVRMIERQLKRGKDVTVLVLCRGGKHRSVAFGENLAEYFGVGVTHHHKHLDRVVSEPSAREIEDAGLQAHLDLLAESGITTPEQFVQKLGEITP